VSIIEQFIRHPPPHLNDEAKANLSYSIRFRYQKQGSQIPTEVAAAMQPIEGLGAKQALMRLVLRAGPRCTATLDICRDTLRLAGSTKFDEMQVADALIYILSGQDWQKYDLGVFITVIREHNLTSEFNWQGVTRAFDRENFRVNQEQFLALFNALLPIAQEEPNFDIQQLWGGMWRNTDAQLSFVAAYSSLPPARLDASKIPRLRRAFTIEDFSDASDAVKQYAAGAASHPMVSLDAIAALLDLGFETPHPPVQQEGPKVFQEVVQNNMDIFLCGAFRLPKPWTETQQAIVLNLFYSFLVRQHQAYEFVLYFLWTLDKQWVATKLVEIHSEDPMLLPILLIQAQEQHWLEDLLMILNGFGLDLAALAHRRGIVDLEQWAQSLSPRNPRGFGFAVSRFLKIKAEDEMRTVRREQDSPKTVSLAVKTVNSLLEILEDLLSESNREELVTIQRLCIQAYPRLINYGEGFDDILDSSGEESNAIPASVDEKMQEYYKRMYSADLDVRDIVEALQKHKRSRDPADQDLFACMIHGLFDEYSCYGEYPLEALATTAVLFGGIINFGLVSGIPLRVALGMILEAVRDYSPEDSMYKFGLQALLHFFPRLQEWPGFCSLLLLVPGLRGTEAFNRAEEVIRERANQGAHEIESNGLPTQNGASDAPPLTNGNMDDIFHPEASTQRFSSVHVDPPLRPEIYEDPDEDVQDKVLFVLNNISERNLDSKLRDLQEALEDKHHLWFANYLVEERAKMQPNFHQLYLDMLTMFGDKTLWAEVLRETYVSAIKMLNAESTMLSSSERTLLKNLGGWLGSLTIARDKPIKHKNISFKDLLIEGYDTQRLIVVIPFTCKVLTQATKSTVFKPPNPWTMDIIRLLIELYHFAELKLNLKFEIEVLCKGLNLDYKTIEPSSGIRERPHPDDDLPGTLSEGLDGFEDISLNTLNRSGIRNERFSPGAITSSLPDLESLLVYPPSSSNLISPAHLKRIVQTAIQRAIQEIISPVVERSVTIAGISTSQLIHKDFAMEPNEERVRQSALTMVKALAGSLALVTCKEPLRMSMTNYIRQNLMQNQYPDQALPEGTILMCVNDNLDTACSMVEKAAEERSMPEIEENIEQGLAARRRHRAARPSEPYIDPSVNRWSFYLPEPYRLKPGGLNREQMAIYEEFARQSRGVSSHGPSDSARQNVNEVIQEQFPAVPNLPTPAEPPAIPHQTQQQPQQRIQIQPTASVSATQAPQVNGFADVKTIVERIHACEFFPLLITILTCSVEPFVRAPTCGKGSP
jgi:CCR4-NOT transcription complex subunit 1